MQKIITFLTNIVYNPSIMINSIGSERQLLETLDRISKHSAKYSAIYINISKLQPKNRHPKFIKILAKLFDGLVGAAMGAFFVLSNGDFVILGSKISQEKINATIANLKKSMRKDPIIHSQETSSFIKIYNFPEDLASLSVQISTVATSQQEEDGDEPEVRKPLENSQVESILHRISNIDFTKIIKRQSVLKIISSDKFNLVSQEFFVALKDLNNEISPNIDLSQNKWMYTYLTETIDQKILNAMFFSNIKKLPKELSINLNISSIFSNDFDNFIKNFITDKTTLTVEVAIMDVFNNLDAYFKAKRFLHSKNFKILIDGITPSILTMIDFKELEPDYIKMFWEPLLEYETDNKAIKKSMDQLPKDSLILAKCSDPKAIKWGFSYGLTAFQGPYIDTLETAIIKEKCPHKNECTNTQCLKRKRLISGSFREECQSIDVLETLLEG